ncbi:MAG: polyprenyl synthetase family protein [Candidatus Bathyarchaeota archaeon]|nr:polyprenyl synthetase family protein [Candidatus Bathyarchaeota archaeon]
MASDQQLKAMRKIFEERGRISLRNAKRTLRLNFKENTRLSEAVQHFSKVTLRNVLPVFPALISISCEAVGGQPQKAEPFGEAIILISGAADIHDDIIDRSPSKGPKHTVYGKFGVASAILAGDALLIQGLNRLSQACETVSQEKGEIVKNLVTQAIFEISNAEICESQLKKQQYDIQIDDCDKIINLKAVVPELCMKIGAIIGDGNKKHVDQLGHFGRTYGIVSIIAEEFADLFDLTEMQNRLKNECPPLPLIYALQDQELRKTMLPLETDFASEEDHEKLINNVLGSDGVTMLTQKVITLLSDELEEVKMYKIEPKIREELEKLLSAPLIYFEKDLDLHPTS